MDPAKRPLPPWPIPSSQIESAEEIARARTADSFKKRAEQAEATLARLLSDEAVEAAARAPFDHEGDEAYWDQLEQDAKESVREDAGRIIEAALKVAKGEGGDGGE